MQTYNYVLLSDVREAVAKTLSEPIYADFENLLQSYFRTYNIFSFAFFWWREPHHSRDEKLLRFLKDAGVDTNLPVYLD